MSSFTRLDCGAQKYAWGKIGKESSVAPFIPPSKYGPKDPLAELWIGTHPSLPSSVVMADGSSSSVPLSEHLKRIGAFPTGEIPFLFKVLSINKALSIQSHPDLRLAGLLHKRNPKEYPDPNHKPEIAVAITPMKALCTFRTLEDVLQWCSRVPEFGAVWGNGRTLRQGVEALYATPTATLNQSLTTCCTRLKATEDLSEEERTFVDLCRQYPNDVGCWFVFVLRLVSLKPFEGLFLLPNEPHAYLSGDCFEIMCTSDNVVRGGLTPKFKDVDVLLNMMSYDPSAFDRAFLPGGGPGAEVHEYVPTPLADFPSFRMVVFNLTPTSKPISYTFPPNQIAFVLVQKGKAFLEAHEEGRGILVTSGSIWLKGVEVQNIRLTRQNQDSQENTVIAIALENYKPSASKM
eukprot:PhF_6_TR30579/c0_g1_i2/m.44959/K01809/manA, MPI; mannose-6-phosphate isomerase